ncbi:MAG: hypothetical protein ACREEE_05375 [Dongiaceae bacterium]
MRANGPIIASIVLLLLGMGAAAWLVTTPWLMKDGRAVEAAGQIAPESNPQLEEDPNDE